eukprot:Opistho-2@28236
MDDLFNVHNMSVLGLSACEKAVYVYLIRAATFFGAVVAQCILALFDLLYDNFLVGVLVFCELAHGFGAFADSPPQRVSLDLHVWKMTLGSRQKAKAASLRHPQTASAIRMGVTTSKLMWPSRIDEVSESD